MQIISKPTFTTPIRDKPQTFITHFAHLRNNIMLFIRMPTQALQVIVRHILIAFTSASRCQTEGRTYRFRIFMKFKRVGTEASVGGNYSFAFDALLINPCDMDGGSLGWFWL